MSTTATETSTLPRLKQRYREEILPALRGQFDFANVMQVPTVTKVVVNMGVGDAARDAKLIDGAIRDLQAITGQKPAVTKVRRSIAQFKLREGMPIGAHVTLRGDRMWEFLDRLTSIALPRIRDFEACRRSSSTAGATTPSVSPSSGVPRDQPGRHRPGSWHGHHSRDDRRVRRSWPSACCGSWASLQGELTWQEGLDQQGEREAQVRGARLQPLPAVRAAALGVPQVRPVPGVSARDGAPRRTPRHHQVQLVIDRRRRRSGPSGPETTAGKRHYDHDDDRPHRRHADPSA